MKNLSRIDKVKRLASDRPMLFSLLVMPAAILLTEIPLHGILLPLLDDPGARFLEGIIEQTLVGLVLVWLLVKLDLFEKARFTSPRQWKALWLMWPLVIITLLNFSSLIEGKLAIDTSRPGRIALYTCLALSIGFFEEVLGRGVILTVMLRKWGHTRRGIYQAVLVSSALFGVAHIINLIIGRLPLLANLTQVVYAFFFAVIFAACVLRNNSIWPMAVMHAAFDFGGKLREIAIGGGSQIAVTNSTVQEAASTIIITLFLFLYGIFILRKVAPCERPGNIFERSEQNV
ncbi:MAG: CPBP family intramembrane metalloprotease [Anaerolineae bacterium]|nr:CPBP family intramembrane metalloprotease [Anaerolineae bacterium]